MATRTQRNLYVELLRFVFTFLVIMTHYEKSYDNNVLTGRWNGEFAVEFFFVVSGYLMASYSAKKEGGEPVWRETWIFIKRKFISIAPCYYAVFLFFVLRYFLTTKMDLITFRTNITRLLSPAFLLPEINLGENISIPYSWYIGSMLLAMFIIFPLLYKFGKTFSRIIAPIITVFFVAFAMQTYGHIVLWEQDWYGICFPYFFRAVAEICLGCASYEMSDSLRRKFKNKLTKTGRIFMTLASLALFVLPIIWIIKELRLASHPCALFMFALGTAITFSGLDYTYKLAEIKIIKNIIGWLGSISLSFYLGQGIVKTYFPSELAEKSSGVYIYVAACFIIGITFYYISKILIVLFRLLKEACTKLFIKETA